MYKELSFFIPFRNEEQFLASTVEIVLSVAQDCLNKFEILLVDDRSFDGSPEIAKKLSLDPNIRVITLPEPGGFGAGYLAGLGFAKYGFAMYLSADGDVTAPDLRGLLQQWHGNMSMIQHCVNDRTRNLFRYHLSRFYTRMVQIGSGTCFNYYNGFNILPTRTLLGKTVSDFGFCTQAHVLLNSLSFENRFQEVGTVCRFNDDTSQALTLKNFRAALAFFVWLLVERIKKGPRRAIAASRIYCSFEKTLLALFYVFQGFHRRFEEVPAYERMFAETEGARFAIATSMARVALYQILKSLDLKRGDRVLLTPVNIPEMLSVNRLLGLEPVFVDFGARSLFPCVLDLKKKAAQSGAKIFFLTYIAGQIGDLDLVRRTCDDLGMSFIQDATQANLCKFNDLPISSYADYTFFSTCELKFVYSYRGAVICMNSESRSRAVRQLVEQTTRAQPTLSILKKWCVDTAASLALQPGLFSIFFSHFARRIFVQDPTANGSSRGIKFGPFRFFADDCARMCTGIPSDMLFRASNFEARLASSSIRNLNPTILRHQEIAARYRLALEGHGILPKSDAKSISTHWRFPVLFDDVGKRETFTTFMHSHGVFVERSGLSMLTDNDLRARTIISNTVFLPCHTGMSDRDTNRVLSLLHEYFNSVSLDRQ
jgi:perosamine synthetase